MAPQNDRHTSRLVVLATVCFYMVAAIAMVLANKWVLMKTEIPVFFLFVQLSIAVVLLAITRWVGMFQISLKLDKETSKALLPMIAINILGLNFNNFTLKYVDASMYQVARGLLLPITVAVSGIILHTRPSLRILVSCAIVTVGFFIGVFIDNLNSTSTSTRGPSLVGVLFGVLSSCTTALHAVVIKRSLEAVNGDTIQLAWYSNTLSAMGMLPLAVLNGEVPGVLELLSGASPVGDGKSLGPLSTFIWGSAVTGFVGFLINIAGFLSIKITSPITHMVSAAVRGVLQTLLSVAFFADMITVGRGSSIATILAGSIYYTWVKNEETRADQKRYTPLPTADPRVEENSLKSAPSGGLHERNLSYSADRIELGDMNGSTSPKPRGSPQ